MKVGVIDMGTNSIRFDIYDISKPGMIRSCYREKVMVRLGEDLFRRKDLVPEARQRAFAALKKFKQVIQKEGVEHIAGVATSACREARNGKSFVKDLRSQLELPIEIISGLTEAGLILEGIRAFEKNIQEPLGFLDIGGGSTEVGVSLSSQTIFLESFQIGAARLKQMHLSDRPNSSELRSLRQSIRKVLGADLGFPDWPKVEKIYGASGTVKAIAKINKAMGMGPHIERTFLSDLVGEMSAMATADLLLIPGMEPKRVDIILSGAIILEEVMHFLNAKEVIRTRFALREGILQEKLKSLNWASSFNDLVIED